MPINHLSTYGLTIERGSAFFGRSLRREISELEDDLQLSMYEHAMAAITQAAWTHYEVSNFARNGQECRHNMSYWLGEPWWAFGPGAASFLPATALADSGEEISRDTRLEPTEPESTATIAPPARPSMVRAVNHASTTSYIRRVLQGNSPIAERVVLTLEERVRERLVFGLRLLSGIGLGELNAMWGGEARPLFEPHLGEYIQRGWLSLHGDRLALTPRGLVISDGLWPDLLQSTPAV